VSRAEPEHLVVGQVSKAHGTKGDVLVWPLTDRPDEVFAAGATMLLGDDEGSPGPAPRELVVERRRPFKKGLLVKFEAYDDRTSAETMARRYLLVAVDELVPPDEDELMYHQLLGLTVETADGTAVGTVREVYETEPTHLLDVKGPERSFLVPLARRIVKTVDLDGGRLVIDPPEGLLDL